MKNEVSIYCLKHPITKEVKYIGRSTRPQERFQQHLVIHATKRHEEWITSLTSVGLKPEMEILETCTKSKARAREFYHIKEAAKTCELVNINYVLTESLPEQYKTVSFRICKYLYDDVLKYKKPNQTIQGYIEQAMVAGLKIISTRKKSVGRKHLKKIFCYMVMPKNPSSPFLKQTVYC